MMVWNAKLDVDDYAPFSVILNYYIYIIFVITQSYVRNVYKLHNCIKNNT